jgi:hypothetical protein
LLVENLHSNGAQFDPVLSRLAEEQWINVKAGSLVKLAEYRFRDSDGGLRRYRLVCLK